MISKSNYKIHEFTVEGWWVLQFMHLTPQRQRESSLIVHRNQEQKVSYTVVYIQRISVDELHHYSMSVIVHRFGNRKASIIQCLKKKRLKSVHQPEVFTAHFTHFIWFVFLPSCRQTPSSQKDETGRARTCSSGVCDNLFCSSDFWRRYDPICEVSEHIAPHLDLQQYRCLRELNTDFFKTWVVEVFKDALALGKKNKK